jgi:hexokinase
MICICVSIPKTIQGGNQYQIHMEMEMIINLEIFETKNQEIFVIFSRYGTDIFKEYLVRDDCET